VGPGDLEDDDAVCSRLRLRFVVEAGVDRSGRVSSIWSRWSGDLRHHVQFNLKYIGLPMIAPNVFRNANGRFPLGRALLIVVVGALATVLVGIGLRVADGSSFTEAASSGGPWIQAGGWVVGAGLFVALAIRLTRETSS